MCGRFQVHGDLPGKLCCLDVLKRSSNLERFSVHANQDTIVGLYGQEDNVASMQAVNVGALLSISVYVVRKRVSFGRFNGTLSIHSTPVTITIFFVTPHNPSPLETPNQRKNVRRDKKKGVV